MTYNTVSVNGTNIFGNSSGEVVTVVFTPLSLYFDTPANTAINPPAQTVTSDSTGAWTVSGLIDPTPDGSGLAWNLQVYDKTAGTKLYNANVQVAQANGASQHWLSLAPPPAPATTSTFLTLPSATPGTAGQIPVANGTGSQVAWGYQNVPASTVFIPAAYGATGNGTTDDTTALQNCFSAAITAHGIVNLGGLAYKTSSAITLNGPVRVTGTTGDSGAHGSIVNSVSDLFTVGSAASVSWENVVLESASGGGHVYNASGCSVNNWKWTNCYLIQANDTKSAWYMPDGTMIGCVFREGYVQHTLTASVATWLVNSSGGGVSNNLWENFRHTYTGAYAFNIGSTGTTYAHGNVVRNVVGEVCNGGFIQLVSSQLDVIEDVIMYDTGTAVNDMISVVKNSNSLACWETQIKGYARLSGSLGSGIADIRLTGAARATVESSGGVIDCANTDVTLVSLAYGAPSGLSTTVSNSGSAINLSPSAVQIPSIMQAPSGTAVAGQVAVATGTGNASAWANAPSCEIQPADIGALAWTFEPARMSAALAYPTATYAGKLMLFMFKTGPAVTLNSITYIVDVSGTVMSNSYLGIYDMLGNLLGKCSTDQSTNMMAAANNRTATFDSPISLAANTAYRVGWVTGAATTYPSLMGQGQNNSTTFNAAGVTGNKFPVGATQSGLTALPGTYTPSAVTVAVFNPLFVMN